MTKRSKTKALCTAKLRANLAAAEKFKIDHAKLVASGATMMEAHKILSEKRNNKLR